MPQRDLVINCPPRCQFHPDKIGWENAHALREYRETGAGILTWGRKAAAILNRDHIATSSTERHLKHYRERTTPKVPEVTERLGDLDILDLVIQRGAANSLNWKPTIKDTIEAMKLKMQMTGNSAFADLISLFDGVEASDALDAAEEALEEAEEAVLSEDERSSGDDEDLEEPFIDS